MGTSHTVFAWLSVGKPFRLMFILGKLIMHYLQNEKTLQRVVSINHVIRLVAHLEISAHMMFYYYFSVRVMQRLSLLYQVNVCLDSDITNGAYC